MKRTFLPLTILALALLGLMVVGSGWGWAQGNGAGPDPRPTPTPDRILSESLVNEPSSPNIPPLPDLVVESIEVIPASPLIGEEATIRVTIANQGSLDVSCAPPTPDNFYTDLYIDPAVVPIQLGQDGVDAWGCQCWWMPVGGAYTLETTYVFTDVKIYDIYAQVDTDGFVEEESESNNVLGPIHVEVRSPNKIVLETHQDFQMGLASNLDLSHPEGVIRRGNFLSPHAGTYTEAEVYRPDAMINDITGTFRITDGVLLTPTVRQVKPALSGDGAGTLFSVWEDGRHGSVWHRRIYFSRSTNQGLTWSPDLLIDPDSMDGQDPKNYDQVSPDLAYDSSIGRLYVVWQDNRDGDYDIYVSYLNDGETSWNSNRITNLISETAPADQMNPSITIGPSGRVYVVWQDRRNGNDDVYLARSDDYGGNWTDNYFVTDDPDMRAANQKSPSIAVQAALWGSDVVYVTWEDWRYADHPEVYVARSVDRGRTFGIDVPVDIPGEGTSYRVEPSIAVGLFISETVTETIIYMHDIHVAWQQGEGDDADIYWAVAHRDYINPYTCPDPYEFCFGSGGGQTPQKVNGFVQNAEYVRPPDPGPVWPIDPSWQGQVSLDLASEYDITWCRPESTDLYSRGVFLAWSDARSYDNWRYEIHTRRAAGVGGAPDYELCNDGAVGLVNDNAKLYAYRNDGNTYKTYQPAATRQSHPYIYRDDTGVYVAWDDDRWDTPSEPGTVRNRDVYMARMGVVDEGIYISSVIDALAQRPIWYALSWWGATGNADELLFQTRFGNTPTPPRNDEAVDGWTRWTGNPSGPFLGCEAGEGCYYDAPGRSIVDPDGDKWPGSDPTKPAYRYMQYKMIIDYIGGGSWNPFKTAVSRVIVHYKGAYSTYLPIVFKNH